MTWRLIQDGAGDPSWNMAIDQAILLQLDNIHEQPTLRFYSWNVIAITVGRFQKLVKTLHLSNISHYGIPIIRRETGGRGVLHGSDLTVSMMLLKSHLPFDIISTEAIYKYLQAGIEIAITNLIGESSRARDLQHNTSTGNCFAIKTKADILGSNNSKLVGSAMRIYEDRILMQCSISVQPNFGLMDLSGIFKGENPVRSYPLKNFSNAKIQKIIIKSYEEAGWRFINGELNCSERSLAVDLTDKSFSPINLRSASEVVDSGSSV